MNKFTRYAMTVLSSLILCISCFADKHKHTCPQIKTQYGQCINIGNHFLYTEIRGNKGPTVVFESGRGNSSESWKEVSTIVSKFAKTIIYDRSGLGFSQNSNRPATAKHIAKNLKILLSKTQLPPPYILVGHSDGGLFVQMFARLYPKLVRAIVLVDSASQNQTFTNPLPTKSSIDYKESVGFRISKEQLKKAPKFPHIPLIVLTATWHGSQNPNHILHLICNDRPCNMTEKQNENIWKKLQNQLANLSPHSIHMYAYGSGHFIQDYHPQLIVDAIYTLVVQSK